MKLVDRNAGNPDSYEELLEAMKHFDPASGGKIRVDGEGWVLGAVGDKRDGKAVGPLNKKLRGQGSIKAGV